MPPRQAFHLQVAHTLALGEEGLTWLIKKKKR